MKDLSLSPLSRGCGRFVSSNGNTGRHDGRLDVCFTPQDYYIWKAHGSLLQLSNNGRQMEEELTLPKTYSTRRGPLLLYSQDLFTIETSYHSETRERKQQVVPRYTEQMKQQLRTIKELTSAILSYSNNQFTSSRLSLPFFPPLHLPLAQDLHRSSPPTQEQSSPELPVQLNPQWLPTERNTEQLQNQAEDEEEEQDHRKGVRLDLFLQIPCHSSSPTPQMEPQPWVHYVAMTPEEEAQTSLDRSQQQIESSQLAEINHHNTGGELQHPNTDCDTDAADNRGCFIQNSETTCDKGNYKGAKSANRHGRTGLLPPLTARHSVCQGPHWNKRDRSGWEGPSSHAHRHEQHLPHIAESLTGVHRRDIQAQTRRDTHPKAERVGIQAQENLNRLHQQPLLFPLLFPGKEGDNNGKQRGEGENTERQFFNKETGGQVGGGGGKPLSEKASMILLEPGEEPPPPVGVLGCVTGKKGPGKQSSLAFLHNQLLDLQDPCESSDANRGVVRGILPLELRDLQNGKAAGSLILGPDGEIIQLSLYDNSQDPPVGDGDTKEQALQVLSAEGEELPWVIVLQPEHTHTEGEVELNTEVPVVVTQQHQSMHKVIDLDRSTGINACSPSSHTEPEALTKRKSSAETVAGRWKAPKKDAKNNLRMLPKRKWAGKGEPRGGDTEAEWGSAGKTSVLQQGLVEKLQFEDDNQCSEQSIDLNEAATEAADKKRQNTKRADTGEAAVTTGKRNMKTVTNAESDGLKASRTMKEGRRQKQKTGSDAQSNWSQKQEERANREAAETQDRSALPSQKKKWTGREGARGEVMMNEEKEHRGEVDRPKEESAGGKRRRGRPKHKELVFENHGEPQGKEEVEINQDMEEKSHLKSNKGPSATQNHHNKTKTNSEEDADTDGLSTNGEKHSSVPSASSLRSSVAASQFNHRSVKRSAASSCEGALPASAVGPASSHGRLSSCSMVMVTEDQLMLNPVKPESSRPRKSRREEEEEAAALLLAQRAERRRQEVERKRREREEEERKQQEREETEERMKRELEEERRKRAEQLRLKRLEQEEEMRKCEEEEMERARREQEQREREKRRQEERKRQMERLQRMRQEEEQRRKAELERVRLENERRQEEEREMLQEMDESERTEYLCRKEQELEDRRNKEEEARMQAELLTRQMSLLQQQLAFKRGLMLEAGGLEKTQGISRPWIYSYFTMLQLLGLNPTKAGSTTP